MKVLQIFGWVVAVHVIAFLFIFVSPGCQTGPRNMPTPDATMPPSPAVAPVAYNSGVVNPVPVDLVTYSPASPSGHPVPTRPGSPTAVAITPSKPVEDIAPVSTYTVGKGDSLWTIAKKNGLSVSELAKANNIGTGAALQPGRKLVIPGTPGVAPKDLAVAAPPSKVLDKSTVAASRPSGESVKHTVQVGESLGVIARKYQVTVGELAAANSITDPSKVRAGQQLIIPGFKAVGTKSTASTPAGAKSTASKSSANNSATAESAASAPAAPHFEIAAPPPGQDLDSGLKDASTEVPTIKVEQPKAAQPPKN